MLQLSADLSGGGRDVAVRHPLEPEAAQVVLVGHDYSQPGKLECDWADRAARDQAVTALARGTIKDRVISTVDPESRHVHKDRASYVDGFKAHESVEPDTGLIVAGHTPIIKPKPLRPSTDHPDAFDLDNFDIDTTAGTVTCPAGQTVTITAKGNASFGVRCRSCPLRQRCTTAKNGKRLKVHQHHDLLAKARRDAADPDWQDTYGTHRPMVERTIAWLVRRGHRRVRYRGIDRNRLPLHHRAAAVNLQRLLNLGLHHEAGRWALPAPG